MRGSKSRRQIFLLSLFFLILLWKGANLYTSWLWFKALGYEKVLLTALLSKWLLFLAGFAAVFFFTLANLLTIRRWAASPQIPPGEPEQPKPAPAPRATLLLLGAAGLILALVSAHILAQNWLTCQLFRHRVFFNLPDPIFQRDVGFYVFQLPLYLLFHRLFLLVAVVNFSLTCMGYFLGGGRDSGGWRALLRSPLPRLHVALLLALIFALLAGGFYLKQFTLLFAGHGVFYGPGYTDIHARIWAYRFLAVAALVCGTWMAAGTMRQKEKYLPHVAGLFFACVLAAGLAYPLLMQKLLVAPNEMEMEKPYIENAIRFTRLAYNLHKIEKRFFPAGRRLTAQDIQENEDTIRNIRLWDYRPLQQTYSQLQEMRLYYELKEVDVDRYLVGGQYRQVMLAARELNQDQLPPQAQTWVNRHLKYTHGYGIVMSPVNEVTGEGLPNFFLKDIPPSSPYPELNITRPEIYFGEATNSYVIVKTRGPEFDYPKGDENAWCTYQGNRGVKIGSLWRRFLFAFSLGDYHILLNRDITSQSQILYYRNIRERVPRIAPFLLYDGDPYIVLANGELFWMWDAYTTTGMFPYAEPYRKQLNYIRNAVKVTVNAYDGSVAFYLADEEDPLIKAYSKIFPELFRPLAEMPAELRKHIRYPEDLFMIQAQKYALYHMEDYRVFYNKEDKWERPTEIVEFKEQPMEAYYTFTRLPGEERPAYVLILPYIPQNKKNMVAWLAARSDEEHYGQLLVYEFPKQELVYGPMQIEARINQDTTISQQLTLWDQRGSRVFRGNLLVIPVKDSLLYVEPLYLQAEQSRLPELRRVIVAHGDRVVMEPTLREALQGIFGPAKGKEAFPPAGEDAARSPARLAQEAVKFYDQALEHLKNEDWAGYGEALKELKRILDELNKALNVS